MVRPVLYATSYYHAFAIDPYASDGGTSLGSIKVFWTRNLPGTVTLCNGRMVRFGIFDTPLLDTAANRLYVVDGSRQLQALDLSTGAPLPDWGFVLDSQVDTGFDGAVGENPMNHQLVINEALRCGNEKTDCEEAT